MNQSKSNLVALCIIALFYFCASLPGRVSAQQKTNVRVYVIPIIDVAPLYAAIEQGYFEAEGLTVDTLPGSGGAAGIPGLIGGGYDFVFTNIVSAVQAKSQGLDIQIVAPGSDARDASPDVSAIFGRSGDEIKTGASLNGKTVAVNTRNNIIWLYAREWISATGGDLKQVKFREIPFPQMADAVKGGQVDVAFAVEPFVTMGVADKSLVPVSYPYAEVQPGMSVAQYVTTGEFIKENPDTVRKFARAIGSGAEWVNANMGEPAHIDLVARYSKLKPDVIRQLNAAQAPLKVDVESVQKTIDLMAKHGMLESRIDANTLIHGDQ